MRRLLTATTLIVLSLSTTTAFAAPKRARVAKHSDAAQREAEKAAEAERLEAEKKKIEADRLEAEKKIEEAKAEQAKAEQAKVDAAKAIEQAKAAHAKPASPPDADAAPTQPAVDRATKVEAVGGGASQGLGFGVGLRVGQTLKSHVYAGTDAMFHFARGDAHVVYTTGVVGYELAAGALKITPAIGGGILLVIPKEGPVGKTPLVYPAVAVRYDIPSTALTVGVDTRLLYLTDADTTALSLAGTAGVRF